MLPGEGLVAMLQGMTPRLLLCLCACVLIACASARTSPAARASDSSITNNQEAGVDEGDIVKAIGDHLVILRRGRIFSVSIAGTSPAAHADQIDARAPGHTEQAWYDEMLVYGRRIVVIGFSYATQSTELGMFQLDEAGKLTHLATYYLRSNDYYSSRNYASRLIEGTLVFYMPYFGSAGPAVARADRTGTANGWTELLGPVALHESRLNGNALHAVVRCSLDTAELRCNASAFSAPYSRSFYVSPNAVYIWVGKNDPNGRAARAEVFRMPLDGSAVSSLTVRGMPVDQFSFQEAEGRLNVLVRGADYGGDAMWAPETESGATANGLALLRVPLKLFDSEVTEVGPYAYQPLPGPDHWSLQNRFVGRYLLWGSGSAWRSASSDYRVFVTDVHDPVATAELKLDHSVDRIEALGAHALVVGASGVDLAMSTIALSETPVVAQTHRQAGAAQGETRSHGFFYLPDEDGRGGVLGLPTREHGGGWWSLFHESAAVAFMRVTPELAMKPLGALKSAGGSTDDACEVSCVDWYGNSRPIFYRHRVFALMGYELVEGRISADHIDEVRRLNYFSKAQRRGRLAMSW